MRVMNSLQWHPASILVLAICMLGASSSDTRCSAGAFGALPLNATILSAVAVPEDGSYGEGSADIAYPNIPTRLPELCAVVVNVTSSSSSSFRFGLLLPTVWNSRFLEVGNGGFNGGINWDDAAVGARYGFASASTDTGHNSTSPDGSWALNNPEAIVDWGWRAIHNTAVISKLLIEKFYSSEVSFSYYAGCSSGGRQGLREAQLYPETFDGILSGAASWWTAHRHPWVTRMGAMNLPVNGSNHISPALFPAIQEEVMKQCDAADGVVDGIISAPDLCSLDFEAFSCDSPGSNASSCLSASQLATMHKIYGPYLVDDKLAFPGLEKGSEWSWPDLLGASEPNRLGTDYERYFLFNDPNWPWENYNDSIIAIADNLDPGSATAYDYDMSASRERGTKILMYHGLSDGKIAPQSSTYFYEQVAAKLGGVTEMGDWFRLFFVPGMGHCSTTKVDAPWYFAGPNQAPSINGSLYSVPGYQDPKHDILLALMNWVENGTAVDSIIATTWTQPSDPSSGVLRQRPLCPYPQKAVWDGFGDTSIASAWSCA